MGTAATCKGDREHRFVRLPDEFAPCTDSGVIEYRIARCQTCGITTRVRFL